MLHEVSHLSEQVKNVTWVPDSLAEKCYGCGIFFSLVLCRRHHCRRCGNVFCDGCSSHRMPLVSAGFFTPVRVCDKCYVTTKKVHLSSGHHHHLHQYPQYLKSCCNESDLERSNSPRPENHPISSSHNIDNSSCCQGMMINDQSRPFHTNTGQTVSIETLPGEVIVIKSPLAQIRNQNGTQYSGTLYLTSYRVVFTAVQSVKCCAKHCTSANSLSQETTIDSSCPSGVDRDLVTYEPVNETDRYHAIPVLSIERTKRKEIPEEDSGVIDIYCKDFRQVQLIFEGLVEKQTFSLFDRTYSALRQYAFGESGGAEEEFAKLNREVYFSNSLMEVENSSYCGWSVYDPVAELNRIGVGPSNKWRITSINSNYEFCPTYSSYIAVPAVVSDSVLQMAGHFRTKSRIPALSWRDKVSGATICRSSQPMVGLGQKQCAEDVFLIQAIASANASSSKLVIVDARPWRNAVAQKTVGRAGYELTAHYETRHPTSSPAFDDVMLFLDRHYPSNGENELSEKNLPVLSECKLIFMGIENIHSMRKSFSRLQELCLSRPTDKWLEMIASTRWIEHISRIIESAVEIVKLVKDDKVSVLVHCSDGWDRTSQLTGLAEVMLDPYYRTIRGFQVLIEKEWVSFGHRFRDRIGHSLSSASSSNEISPIFLQWIDSVWQLQQQFPCSFEFNERFLITILDHLYSCRFGTFLYNSEKEREEEEAKKATISLWTYVNSVEASLFSNPFYDPQLYSRKNWQSRITARRQCVEIFNVKSKQTEGSHIQVKHEEKDDGVVLIHTDKLKVEKSVSDDFLPIYKEGLKVPEQTKDENSNFPQTRKPHSIVHDLDVGLMFPHSIDTKSSPYSSPRKYCVNGVNNSNYVSLNSITQEEEVVEDDFNDMLSSSDSEDFETLNEDAKSFGPNADVLIPNYSQNALRLWTSYYYRWDTSCSVNHHSNLEMEAKLRDVCADRDYLEEKVQYLEQQIQEMTNTFNQKSNFSFSSSTSSNRSVNPVVSCVVENILYNVESD